MFLFSASWVTVVRTPVVSEGLVFRHNTLLRQEAKRKTCETPNRRCQTQAASAVLLDAAVGLVPVGQRERERERRATDEQILPQTAAGVGVWVCVGGSQRERERERETETERQTKREIEATEE